MDGDVELLLPSGTWRIGRLPLFFHYRKVADAAVARTRVRRATFRSGERILNHVEAM